jgi:shikimate kinase
VTGAAPTVEVDELLARRRPLYAEVAAVQLDAEATTELQVEQALARLGARAHVFA